jgi:hypothetical protein
MMARTISLLGLCALAFIAGAILVTFELFPYRQFRDARLALDAAAKAVGIGYPPVFMGYDDAYSRPTVFGNRQAQPDDDLVLIAGGPYELMDHCPRLGCLAWLVDRTGTVVHAWPLELEALWGDLGKVDQFGPIDNIQPMGLHLFPNGDLLASFQSSGAFPFAIGVAKVDKDGRILWRRESLSHHWFSIDEAGRIYIPSVRAVPSPISLAGGAVRIVCELGYIYEDLITVLDGDGHPIREFSVLQALRDSGYPGLLHYAEHLDYSQCDPTHLNDVRVLPARLAAEYPDFAAGDLLISMRTNNAVAVLDGASGRVKWLLAGRTVGQHSPRFAGANKIIVFDNKGGSGASSYSRVVEIDVATNATRTLFPSAASGAAVGFSTDFGGHIDLHRDGHHALLSVSRQGRILEVDLASGAVVWQYVNTHAVPNADRPVRMVAIAAYYAHGLPFMQVSGAGAVPAKLSALDRLADHSKR